MSAPDPYRYFRIEARELLDGLRGGLAALDDASADPGRLPLLLRLAHTLKGAARVVRLPAVSDLAHRIEDILAPCRDAATLPAPAQRAALRQLLDAVAAALAGLDQPAAVPAPVPHAPAPAVAPIVVDTVRLQVAEVDALLNAVAGTKEDVALARADLGAFAQRSRPTRRLLELAAREATGPEAAGRLRSEAGDLAGGIEHLSRRVGARLERVERDLARFHEDAGRLRLIPIEALRTFLERVAHDAAEQLGRSVRLEFFSRAPRLEAAVFAGLQEALQHLVRNAVVHGIESGPDRLAAGKPPAGRIQVRLTPAPGRLLVSCEDDGRGLDLEALRRAAVDKGLLAGPAAALDLAGAVALLLRGGLTTTRSADEMSGRGLGLETARAAVDRLGGTMTIRSTPGRATAVDLDLPLALSALEMLAVASAGRQILLPLAAVQRVHRAAPSALRTAAAGEELAVDDRLLPCAALHRLLPAGEGATASGARNALTAVVVHHETGGAVAVLVDRLLGTTEAVVRPLPALAAAAPCVAGAVLTAGGPPRLVLDPAALVAAIRAFGAAPAAPAPARAPILVVDDSLTTRMLEQSILESAGYTVDTAVSAEAALERLRERRYGLVLVDVEMPGMDGFALVEHLRHDPVWRDLPAILVTSRDSRADRRRGLAAGAQDYVIKGEFDQRRLLRRIGELLA